MKTNYAQHLAWFEHSVRPNVMTNYPQETRCWHATSKKRPTISYEQLQNDSHYDREDSLLISSNPRKRQRVQMESPFLTTMQDEEDAISDHSPQSPSPIVEDAFLFDQVSDVDMTLVDEEEEVNQAQISNYTPVRTASEISVYYDAPDTWDTAVEPPSSPAPNSPRTLSRRQEVETILYQHFRLKGFIRNQYEAITAAMDEHDIFVVLPSGPSRNLCYQLPVLFQHPSLITVILVPTLVYLLQKDDHTIETHCIPTTFVTKSKKTHKKNWISRDKLTFDTIKNNHTQLLYMTYDDFSKCKSTIQCIYQDNLLARFIIDEAHCISQWGTDFHFGYLRTSEQLKSDYPNIPMTALTAIPNERIHLDIMNNLDLKNCKIFKKSILL